MPLDIDAVEQLWKQIGALVPARQHATLQRLALELIQLECDAIH